MAKISAFCTLLVLAVAVAAGANDQNCTTDEDSPKARDAYKVVESVRYLGNTPCCQENCEGDFCTVLQSIRGARVSICGDCGSCIPCNSVADALVNVLKKCTRVVGGTNRCSGEQDADGLLFTIDAAPGVTNDI